MKKSNHFLFFYLFIFTFGMIDTLRGVFIPLVKGHYSLSYTSVSLLIGVSSLGYFFGNILGSYLYKIMKYKQLIVLTYFFLFLSFLGMIFVRVYPIYLISFFIYGVFASILFVIITIFTYNFSTKNKSSSMNILHFFYSFGAMLSPIYATILEKHHIVYSNFLIIPFILFMLTFIGMIKIIPHKPIENKSENTPFMFNKWIMTLFIIIAVFYIWTEIGISGWVKNFMEKALHKDFNIANNYLTVFFISLMLGRLFSSQLVKKFKNTISYILILQILGTAVFALGYFSKYKILMVISALFFGGVYPTLITKYKDFIHKREEYMGFILSAGSIGSLLSALVIGGVNDCFGLFNGMLVNIFIAIITIILILTLSTHFIDNRRARS
ncbi:MFS transporter [bacterium]|nr:MFS transporter [bacterium]